MRCLCIESPFYSQCSYLVQLVLRQKVHFSFIQISILCLQKMAPTSQSTAMPFATACPFKNSLGGEGSQKIVFEKFAPGRQGASDKILFQREVAVTSLPQVREMVDELAKKI